MKELMTMVIRYLIMIIVGMLVSHGYAVESLQEPIMGLGLAVFAVVWKLAEARGWIKGL